MRAGSMPIIAALLAGPAVAASLREPPPIRLSASNPMPACVTPSRLMAFLKIRTGSVSQRFRRIADFYRKHGEAWRVRWDFAFFQMALETNFLTYRQANGRWGDVKPSQNNFAGIGTTGGGVPGNAFPDVSTGVLAQIHHLVVYSGERVAKPAAPRTALKQDHILALSVPVAAKRPVTFQDLSGRWAVDKRYGRSMLRLANMFYARYCTGPQGLRPAQTTAGTAAGSAKPPRTTVTADAGVAKAQPPLPGRRETTAARPPVDASTIQVCRVQVAGDTGRSTVLIQSRDGPVMHLTALQTPLARESNMQRAFIAAHAKGGRAIARYASPALAVSEARRLCRRFVQTSPLR